MFIGEYDYDLDMQVKAEEAREEGLAEGREEGLAEGREEGQQQKAIEAALTLIKEYKETPEIAAKKMNAPLDKVLEAYNSVLARR